jgi:hypothetical protein
MNEKMVTGFENASEYSVALNPGLIDVSKGCVEIWKRGMQSACNDPLRATQTDPMIFKQLNNNSETYSYAEMTGMGLWHKKDENNPVQQGAGKLGPIKTVEVCDWYKDLVITDKTRRLDKQSGGTLIPKFLNDFIDKARKTDEIYAFAVITNGTYGTVTLPSGQTYETLVTVTGVVGTPTPAQIESGLEAALSAQRNHKDTDGYELDCADSGVLLVSEDLLNAATKALQVRSDNCCGANGQQLSFLRGVTLKYSPRLPKGSAYHINGNASIMRNIVDPIEVLYVPHQYNEAHKAIYRGHFANRYFIQGDVGVVKIEFTA